MDCHNKMVEDSVSNPEATKGPVVAMVDRTEVEGLCPPNAVGGQICLEYTLDQRTTHSSEP